MGRREFVDHGVSGAKERRPALDAMVADAKRRRFDAVVVWRLDRLGRNLKHLITLIDEMQALGIAFVSLGEGIDATTPAGKLQLHILAAIAEFERARIQERVLAGLGACEGAGQAIGPACGFTGRRSTFLAARFAPQPNSGEFRSQRRPDALLVVVVVRIRSRLAVT